MKNTEDYLQEMVEELSAINFQAMTSFEQMKKMVEIYSKYATLIDAIRLLK